MSENITDDFKQLKKKMDRFVKACEDLRHQIDSDYTALPAEKPTDLTNQLEKQERGISTLQKSAGPWHTKKAREFLQKLQGYEISTREIIEKLAPPCAGKDCEGKLEEVNGFRSVLFQKVENLVARYFSSDSGPSTENLFLNIMDGAIGKEVTIENGKTVKITKASYKATKALFEKGTLTTAHPESSELLDCWTAVIVVFTEQTSAQSGNPSGKVDFEAEFFVMHSLLEELYERFGKAASVV